MTGPAEVEMTGPAEVEAKGESALSLADFLSDLREELAEASRRAAGSTLKLEVTELTTTLDVSVTLQKSAEGSVGVKAKFWVFASAEAGLKGTIASERVGSQQVNLKLTPSVEVTVTDADGKKLERRSVYVYGSPVPGEQDPQAPADTDGEAT
jgi:hypothetical protein